MNNGSAGLRTWTQRFTVASVGSFVSSLLALLGEANEAAVLIGVFGFICPMVFGMAYLLLPSYVGETLVDQRLAGIHFVLAYVGVILLVADQLGTEEIPLKLLGVTLWAIGTLVFVGSLLATVGPTAVGTVAETLRGSGRSQRSTRLATTMIPVAVGYLPHRNDRPPHNCRSVTDRCDNGSTGRPLLPYRIRNAVNLCSRYAAADGFLPRFVTPPSRLGYAHNRSYRACLSGNVPLDRSVVPGRRCVRDTLDARVCGHRAARCSENRSQTSRRIGDRTRCNRRRGRRRRRFWSCSESGSRRPSPSIERSSWPGSFRLQSSDMRIYSSRLRAISLRVRTRDRPARRLACLGSVSPYSR